ncbi:MAG: hypothetical protein R2746_08385 [Acidimicrobiales bacterium]
MMVPVPEEHLAEVQAGLMRLSLGMAGWDDDSIATVLDGLEELGPNAALLVREVARASADHDRVPYRDAAALLDVSVGDVLQLVTELNDWCRRHGVPALLITDTLSLEADGGDPASVPVLVTVAPVARRLLERWPPRPAPITNP